MTSATGANMSNALLRISDGTTTVDLMSRQSGFHIYDWTPTIVEPKDGGVWQSSPLSDGRRLAYRKWTNAIESLSLKVNGADMNAVIQSTQDLRRLLEQAVTYWVGTGYRPVWLEARGSCETYSRYAILYDWRTVADDNPYAQPLFSALPVMDDFTLLLERGHWLSCVPGGKDCVKISNLQDWSITAAGGANLITNGDFTAWTTTYPADWASWVETRTHDDNIVISTAGHAGVCAVIHVQHNPTRYDNYALQQLSQDIVTEGGKLYELRFWVRCYEYHSSDGSSAAAPCHYDIWDATHSLPITGEVSESEETVSSVWHQLIVRFTAPAGCISTKIRFWGSPVSMYTTYDQANAYTYVDTVECYKITQRVLSLGRAATCDKEVYVANKHNLANLSYVMHYDASATTYSTNLLSSALPYALLPDPAGAGAGDIAYFGIETSIINSGPFDCIIFDLATPTPKDTQGVWEYYDGDAWVAFAGLSTVVDNTRSPYYGRPFSQDGVCGVHWRQPPAATTAVNGITAWWVRFRVTVSSATAPVQQNRHVYTVTQPYVELDAGQVGGDLSALAELLVYSEAGSNSIPVNYLQTTQLFVSLRSLSRGALFSPYLTAAQTQNLPGMTVTVAGGSMVTSAEAITGKVYYWNPAGASTAYCQWSLDENLARQYNGTFHAYVRLRQDGGVIGDMQVRLAIDWGGMGASSVYYTEYMPTTSNLDYICLDLGVIHLPPYHDMSYEDTASSLAIRLEITNSNAAPGDLYLYDVILMPTDEWCAETHSILNDAIVDSLISQGQYLQLDSLTYPKRSLRALVRDWDTQQVNVGWQTIADGEMILQPNTAQRLWFFCWSKWSSPAGSRWETVNRILLSKASRYFSMRGSR